MNNNKLLSFLGLCRRAGKMTIGSDAAAQAMKCGESCLVLLAEDVSQHTAKAVENEACSNNVKAVRLDCSKQQLSDALGKLTAVISVNDAGFAKKIIELTGKE